MAGLYSALNIAKNSLLAFQTGVHVTGHNVANVDTEGYSRQKTVNAPYPPTPGPAGPMGSGVKVEQIKRYFDAFLEANINLKRSDLGLLAAEETGLDLIQGLFNEANEFGLSRLLEDFFTAWQGLANRAEGIPERRVVIEKGRVLAEAIRDKNQGLVDLENNIRLKLRDVIGEINELAKQIAEINRQITAAESGLHQANDLRDQRDKLVARLSELAQVRYFENNQGAYAVVLGNGYNLVDIDSYWELELSGGEVYWRGHSGEKVRLTSKEVSQGKLGGWLRIIEQISSDWNYEYVISSRPVFTRKGNLLRENTTWEELGLSGTIKISFQGTNHYGEEIQGTYQTTDPQKTIRDFLNEIEKAYDYKVQAYLTDDGRLVVKDAVRGGGKLSFAIIEGPLDFGRFDDEAANHRVKELNLTGKFQLFAEELIRGVNEIHTEGVGLKFFEGELEGLFQSDGSIKSLDLFRDIKRDGSLFIWIKDSVGNITPVKIDFALPATATLDDLTNQINEALKEAGFDPETSVKALFRNGRLVFKAQEGWGFAFSNDTANVLLATGINVFFAGTDAGSIAINENLSVNPEYLAAARLDREAWRSEVPFAGSYKSHLPIANPEQKIFNDPAHKIYVRFFDATGNQILHETENGFKVKELAVELNPGDTLEDILNKLDAIEGFRAYIDGNGRLTLELDPNSSKNYAYFELGIDEPPPADSFLHYLREQGVWVPQYVASRGRMESTDWYEDPSSVTVNEDAELNFVFYDAEGRETERTSLSVANGTTLKDLASLIDALPEFRAGFTEGDKGKLYITLAGAPEGSVSFKMTVSGGNGNGVLDLSSGGSLELSSIPEKQIFSGLEPLIKPTLYLADLSSLTPQNLLFSGFTNIKFFDQAGNEIQEISFGTTGSPDVSISDANGNGKIDLEDLVSALNSRPELKAYLDNGKLFISLGDSAPANAAYFVIEGNSPSRPWGSLRFVNDQGTTNPSDDEYFDLSFQIGALENWLFDGAGNPIDTDPVNEVVDPFRVKLETGAGAIQIVKRYNAEENARFGLSAHLDDQGRLVVKTSGLYDTRSFVVRDAFHRKAFETSGVKPNKFDAKNNLWYLKTDEPVERNASFGAQDINIEYLKPDGTTLRVETISLSTGQTLENFLDALNVLDTDSDGIFDFSATIDDSGRLTIEIKDPDLDNDGRQDWVSFKLSTSLTVEEGNLITYLARKTFAPKDNGLIDKLQGLAPQPGDNRNALRLAALSDDRRERLGQASVADFYISLVGEVGITTKTVKNSKNFVEDLINQLQIMRDSISGVSLDEEMANLIKYQQAFAASAKILTVADEMLDTLIQAKR